MTRWEYRTEMPTADFNNLGAEGWELCGVLHNGMAVFKRLCKQKGADEFDGWIGGTRVREVLD